MNHEVFISYSNKDKNVADAIVNRFESGGLKCWYAPRDINPGNEWAESIVKAIKASKTMVLIFTDYSNASKQVIREVETAINNGVAIIPFKLTASKPSGSMEYYLSTLHWLDAMNTPLDNAINDLKEMAQNLNNSKSFVQKKKKNKKTIIITSILIVALIVIGIFFIISNKNNNKESDVFIPVDYCEKNINYCLSKNVVYYYDNENFYLCYLYNGEDGISYPLPTSMVLDMKESDFSKDANFANYFVALNPFFSCAATKDYIFIANSKGVIRYEVSSEEEITVYNKDAENLCINGDWLLFIDSDTKQLMRVNFDGSKIETFNDVYATSFFIHDNRIYFISNDEELCIYDKGVITKADIQGGFSQMCFDNDNSIYVFNGYNRAFYRIDLDGSFNPELVYVSENTIVPWNLSFWNGNLYYSDIDYRICELDLETQRINDVPTEHKYTVIFNIIDGHIYAFTMDEISKYEYTEIIELQ